MSYMEQDLQTLKIELQRFFGDGLVVVVGSGLSAALGLPSMPSLAAHLVANVKSLIQKEDNEQWDRIACALSAGAGLEAALLADRPSSSLNAAILSLTVQLVEEAELTVLRNVIEGNLELPFSRILPHINPEPNRALPVVSTNYDRLVEAAAEMIGWGVDSTFIGTVIGTMNAKISTNSFIRDIVINGRSARKLIRERIRLLKPHGSLDWYHHPRKGPLKSSVSLALPRLMITPGGNKYREGYNIPFDTHRETANSEIDRANRILIIGYGFNDDHLETHLSGQLQQGKPALILTRDLSEKAYTQIVNWPNTIALSRNCNSARGFLCSRANGSQNYDDAPQIWNLDHFVTHILQPHE